MQSNESPDSGCDVLIVGSGSAALTAALTTAAGRLVTLIVEKTEWIGGTSAMSGGAVWIPANHHARAAGIADSAEDALAYLRATAPDGWRETEDALWRAFADASPEVLPFVEAHSPLRFALTDEPDPFPDLPGGRQRGRMVSPRPLSRRVLGEHRRRLRAPIQPHIFTYHELTGADLYHRPIASSLPLLPRLLRRLVRDERGQGTAMVAGLLRGALDHGATLALETPAVALSVDGTGRVSGAIVERQGQRRRIAARRGVVLASGGFEWDRELLARHFPGPIDFIASPAGNTGDAHRMAAAAGAAMAHMDQANISSAIPSTYQGRPHAMALFFHGEANAILVDRTGRRFVDEFTFNFGEVLDRRDPATGLPVHLPVWLISDDRFLRKSPVIRWYMRKDANWIVRAETIAGLAAATGLPPGALADTVARFNDHCAKGRDPDFGRGEGPGHGWGPARQRGLFEPIIRPPFLAIPFSRSILATKGGPRTNAFGEVLRPDGTVIPGLYCAGVAMANPIGTRAVGAGTTLGPNMVWGYICGRRIVSGATA